jgi:hypothetical protein
VRDPERVLDGKVGRVVRTMPTITGHEYEVRFEDGTVLRGVPVPEIDVVRVVLGSPSLPETVDLAEPNFCERELELIG